jgi:hypothetical protein
MDIWLRRKTNCPLCRCIWHTHTTNLHGQIIDPLELLQQNNVIL